MLTLTTRRSRYDHQLGLVSAYATPDAATREVRGAEGTVSIGRTEPTMITRRTEAVAEIPLRFDSFHLRPSPGWRTRWARGRGEG
eukprot:COSAG01_NODE_4989_length_4568_cov_6.110141_3_plen_85_part_00